MRLLVTVRLENGLDMNIITDAASKEAARSQAAKLSARLLGDKELYVTKTSKIIACEEWEKDKRLSYQNGNKEYMVSFMMDNVVQVLNIEASGVKGAYNNIKIKYGIQESGLTLVFEKNQKIKRKSVISTANNILNDKDKSIKLLKVAVEKINKTPNLKEYRAVILDIIAILTLELKGKYTKVDNKTLYKAFYYIVYFVNPTELFLDISEETSKLNSIEALRYLAVDMSNDVQKYREWLCNEKGLVAVGQ
jgi:hypothetical protein